MPAALILTAMLMPPVSARLNRTLRGVPPNVVMADKRLAALRHRPPHAAREVLGGIGAAGATDREKIG